MHGGTRKLRIGRKKETKVVGTCNLLHIVRCRWTDIIHTEHWTHSWLNNTQNIDFVLSFFKYIMTNKKTLSPHTCLCSGAGKSGNEARVEVCLHFQILLYPRTLYCAKGNYEFGISRIMKSLEPYSKKVRLVHQLPVILDGHLQLLYQFLLTHTAWNWHMVLCQALFLLPCRKYGKSLNTTHTVNS